ncbi:MAG: sodium-dependent transporter, partial [Paramuribaculum sp.]|nr:sodium-dependent transporter [Paramuribaculum sp.]
NVWRFPAEVQANGGAAFLIIYALCVILLGIPVMVAEFSLGRSGRSDAAGAFINIGARKGWSIIGGWAILASYLILCFYMVVAGWTIEYVWQSLTGALFEPTGTVETTIVSQFSEKMNLLTGGSISPLIFTFIVIFLNLIILVLGVQKGIERLSTIMMPLLFLILVVFLGVALTLPEAGEGLRFFLEPDFSKITPGVCINALGQAFFSLSLGMGILITYSSYFPSKTRLTKTAITVSALDMVIAIMMGLIIFPAVTSFGLTDQSTRGATLVFVTLPEVFSFMPYPRLWATLFFLLLTLAAITSTISIAEVSVAFICDRFKISRTKSCLIVLLPLLLFSTLCALSFGPLSHITFFGLNIFDFLDTVATNVMLPVGSIALCIYLGWFAPKNLLHDQITNRGSLKNALYRPILIMIKYAAPPLILIVLISSFL